MRRVTFAIVALLACSLSFGDSPASFNVSNTSCKVVAERGVSHFNIQAMTNTQHVSQGQFRNVGGVLYWALNAGVTTNAPSGSGDFTLDTIVWRHVPSDKRRGLVITSLSTNVVSLSIGAPAIVGKGVVLPTYGSSFSIDAMLTQEAVYAVCGTVSAEIAIQEW